MVLVVVLILVEVGWLGLCLKLGWLLIMFLKFMVVVFVMVFGVSCGVM